ncbi:hypothetical protein BV25DRAFT_1843736 [Artomyces pyxidatus]|uniref:Uncharacterized protein n=1 Tax=Artomyces pyxidatus TaxID=48021 RepID=A0ACB8SCW3_9AGAM|nr:hypothetical protein BV25DRAFT_1843736 [Artomyces pyxidatus]
MRDLNDSEFEDNFEEFVTEPESDNAEDSDGEVVSNPPDQHVSATITRTQPYLDQSQSASRSRGRARAAGLDVVNKLAQAFDPDVQRARDEDRSARALQQTQYLAFSQQMHDAQAELVALRSQLADANRALDLAEMRAEMRMELQQIARGNAFQGSSAASRGRPHTRPVPTNNPVQQKQKRRYRQDIEYPDGGHYTYWVSEESDGDGDSRPRQRSRSWRRRIYPPGRSRTPSPIATPNRRINRSCSPWDKYHTSNNAEHSGRRTQHAHAGHPSTIHGAITPCQGPAVSLRINPHAASRTEVTAAQADDAADHDAGDAGADEEGIPWSESE